MKNKIQNEIKSAMREKNKIKLSTLRALLSAMQYVEMEKSVDQLSDKDALAVVKSEIKKRKEEQDFAKQAGRDQTVAELNQEIAALEEFLPSQLSAEQLKAAIEEIVKDSGASHMGEIMKGLSCKIRRTIRRQTSKPTC